VAEGTARGLSLDERSGEGPLAMKRWRWRR